MTLEALVDFEIQWRKSPSIDPIAFVAKYPGLPREVLLAEVQNLRDELSSELQPVELLLDARQPRFTILDEIRVGGMGVVYLGWDHDCNRHVAIKKILPEFRSDPMVQARFHVEAELTADLEHPGIIPIYGRGLDSDGQAFYAMRLISRTGASTLSRAIQAFHNATAVALSDSGIDAFRQLVRHLIEVANTIAFCHKRGVVHRDLKPANILLGPYGETLVADWGLAKRMTMIPSAMDTTKHDNDAAYILESSGSPVGTLGYAAPELSLKTDNADLHLSDIYSMGAILHSILFGLPPSESTQKYAGLAPPLTSRVSIIPRIRYLVAIANMATSRDRFLRYRSAEAFRDDLLRWIEGESIDAMPESWIERIGRWISKHRTLASVLATAFGITVLAGSVFLWYQSNQRQLLDNQAVQLRSALADSARLLEKTQNATKLAELSQLEAQERGKQAQESREVAEKRELLAFEGLLRIQDILLDNQSAFESERLEGVKDQLLLQTKETFAGILDNLSENSSPQHWTLRNLHVLTHRLSAMERLAGRPDQALAVIDQACAWMQRCLNVQGLSDDIETDLQLRIGSLRNLQAIVAMESNKVAVAMPAVDESITRLSGLVESGLAESGLVEFNRLSVEDKKEALAVLAQSYTARSSINQTKGESNKAIADQLKALELIDSQQPETFTAAMASAQAHYGMAILHIQSQKPEQAIEQFDLTSDALVLAEKLSTQALPLEFLVYRSQLAYNRSNLLFSQNQPLRAIEILKHQLQADTQAVSDFQPNQIVLEAYHRNANFLHALYIQSGRQSEAVEVCRAWIEIAEKLLSDFPQSEPILHCAIQANHFAGHLEHQINHSDEAQSRYRKALVIYDQATANEISSARLFYQKVELEMHLLDLHYQFGSDDQAESIFERAMDAAQRLKGMKQSDSQELTSAIQQLKRCIDAMRNGSDLDLASRSEAKLKSAGLWRAR
jgi:serine/threonine protein kinase